jgi:pimeloyl-ACP methyl ester carboxylesterase
VRVEKTGMGDSEGPPCEESDFETELNGYRAALKSLGSYPFMDTTRVILLGHSMGGIIAPLLFPEYPVKGIIAMATCGTSWLEYELVNTRRQLLLEGMAADSLEDRMRTKELALHELLVNQRAPEDILKDHPELGEDLQYPCHYTYIQQVAARNVMEDWRRVNVPVLLLWGRGDFVTAREDHTYLSDAINRDHPALATYSEIEKMDHFLCKIGSERESWDNLEAGRPNREFCDDVIPEILRWTQTVLAGR